MCPRITDTDFFTNYHKKQPYYKDQNKTNVLSLHSRVDSWSGTSPKAVHVLSFAYICFYKVTQRRLQRKRTTLKYN